MRQPVDLEDLNTEQPGQCDICRTETPWLTPRQYRFFRFRVWLWICPVCNHILANRSTGVAAFLGVILLPAVIVYLLVLSMTR